MQGLTTLYLDRTNIGADGAQYLFDALQYNNVT